MKHCYRTDNWVKNRWHFYLSGKVSPSRKRKQPRETTGMKLIIYLLLPLPASDFLGLVSPQLLISLALQRSLNLG